MRKRAFFFLVALSLLANCSTSANKAKALEEIQRFHQNFNNNDFSSMYDVLDEEGRMGTSLERFTAEMSAMRKGQGAVLKSEEVATEYLYDNGKPKTRLLVSVTYEKGTAREEFVFSHSTGKTSLSGYRFLGP
ncbi:MAG TPA: hypothetical protein VGO68_19905 [Pyrinomonadaceae bacterium]|jgi:hypothetical protein|nr:hypothetical protein [Pyrinomonadaceae bacterium]